MFKDPLASVRSESVRSDKPTEAKETPSPKAARNFEFSRLITFCRNKIIAISHSETPNYKPNTLAKYRGHYHT
ncbi:hypothetical protein NONS58_02530 [Nitrosococcus oceani]|nr:hypothetical protein NONS58_02530 [Nitrosococcus oceani]